MKIGFNFRNLTALIICAPMLAACGGGGGSSPTSSTPIATTPTTPPPTVPSGAPSFQPGVFEPASNFIDRCENPRFGSDIEGNAFTDRAGSTLEEQFWLRSWTNETYLFRTEVVDRDPNDFPDRLSYFDVLRTTAVTASGEDKDDFHFSQPTEEFLENRTSAPTASYGVRYAAFSSSAPRDFRVLYTDPGTPASAVVNGLVNFPRGARILEVDGVDLVNAPSTQSNLDTLNNGLFPRTAGEQHTFVIQEAGTGTTRSVTLTSANLATAPVNRTRTFDTPSGKVGYILFNTFSPFASEAAIANAFEEMATEGVQDLILDLRYNGGGLLAVASQLGYLIAGEDQTDGRTFELLEFNDLAGNRNPVTGEINGPIPFYSTGLGFSLNNGTPLQSLDLPRVFILSTERTCSASEAVINGLRGIDVEVVLIGDQTCGKPFGFYPTDNCGETYFTIQFQGANDAGFAEYTDGFIPQDSSFAFGERLPGCTVADDFSTELGEETEDLVATALYYREMGACPSPSEGVNSGKPAADAIPPQLIDGDIRGEDPVGRYLSESRDLTLPQ